VAEELQRLTDASKKAFQRNRSPPQGMRRLGSTMADMISNTKHLATLDVLQIMNELNKKGVYEGSGKLNASRYAHARLKCARQHTCSCQLALARSNLTLLHAHTASSL
jgi:hypothetical protein